MNRGLINSIDESDNDGSSEIQSRLKKNNGNKGQTSTSAMVDQRGSISSFPEEYHDNPEQPRHLLKSSEEKTMDLPVSSHSDLVLFAIGFTAAQVIGIICIVLVWIWMGSYLGGFSWNTEHTDPSLQFNYHPLFMVIGMVFLYGDAILVYRVLRSSRKIVLKIFHGSLHLLVFIFAVIALKAVFDYHSKKGITNLYTLHSWMGITTITLFGLQYVFGFVSFLYPGLTRNMRIRMLPLHIFTGLMIFIMAVGCCVTGITGKLIFTLKDDYQFLKAPSALANSLGVCIILYAILVVFLATSSRFKRQPLPEEAMLQLEPQSPAY